MQSTSGVAIVGLLGYALRSGLIKDGKVCCEGKLRELERFGNMVVEASKPEVEQSVGISFGATRDVGNKESARESGRVQASDYDTKDELLYAALSREGVSTPLASTIADSDDGHSGESVTVDTCFATMCKHMGSHCESYVTSVSQLPVDVQARLRTHQGNMIAYDWYAQDDPRNHVTAVVKGSKTAVVTVAVDGGDGSKDCVHGITSPQEFFNTGGRFYRTSFYSYQVGDETLAGDEGFGGDAPTVRSGSAALGSQAPVPRPPESVVNGGASGGGANITGGVIRPKRRAIKARSNYDVTAKTLRNYNVVGVTMFNNAEELFLNTISREYAQEIIEDLFSVWELPTDQASTMKYAEDLLWTFMIARTASNKADYKVVMDVPTSKGAVEINFDRFSRLLADKYGITRRNFARGVSDDLREFMRREENQFLRSRASQRIGADPQMGDLCFDGSTGCSGLTSAETTFTRILEARNLYERDDVIAEGASDRLMQGVHGGVRSIVPR